MNTIDQHGQRIARQVEFVAATRKKSVCLSLGSGSRNKRKFKFVENPWSTPLTQSRRSWRFSMKKMRDEVGLGGVGMSFVR
jgi:hypothetical protein